jgi:hypothetical protein
MTDQNKPVPTPRANLTEEQLLSLLMGVGRPEILFCDASGYHYASADYHNRFNVFFAAHIGDGWLPSSTQWNQWARWCVQQGIAKAYGEE